MVMAEYADDYDDQYDDPSEAHVGMSAGTGLDVPVADVSAKVQVTSKESRRKGQQKANKVVSKLGSNRSSGSFRSVGTSASDDIRRYFVLMKCTN